MESACPSIFCENSDLRIPSTKPRAGNPNETTIVPGVQVRTILAEEVNCSSTDIDDKSCSEQQQSTRRPCLVSEISGAQYRKLLSDSASSSISKLPANHNTSKEKCLVTNRPGSNKFSSLPPGIGLHINTLAATSREKLTVKRKSVTSSRQLVSYPSPLSSFNLLTSDKKPLNTPIAPKFAGNKSDEQKEGVQMTGTTCQNSTSLEIIQFYQSSPKKERWKSDIVGENDSYKGCICKRSKCLKLYCKCFAAGLYCAESCNCQDCFNKPIHNETVFESRRLIESRNPLAFAPKVIKCPNNLNNGDELNKAPVSARHKKGCNCIKSGCLKKYCECFQVGVGCSLSCRCKGCKNTFGRKEGTPAMAIYANAQMIERKETN